MLNLPGAAIDGRGRDLLKYCNTRTGSDCHMKFIISFDIDPPCYYYRGGLKPEFNSGFGWADRIADL